MEELRKPVTLAEFNDYSARREKEILTLESAFRRFIRDQQKYIDCPRCIANTGCCDVFNCRTRLYNYYLELARREIDG